MGIVDELAPLVASLERSLVTEGLTVVGSRASGHADAESDVDLFVFVLPDRDVDVLSAREDLAQELADPTRPCVIRQTGHPYADAWTLGGTGLQLDVMFWSTTWAEEELDWRLGRHQRQVGEASTAFWRSIRDGLPVFDRSGWVGRLQQRACTPFPDELRSEVLRYNMDLLGRENPSSFFHQLDKAIRRGDHVAANHTSARWVACYFDAVFAANRVLHPGEKRLVQLVTEECRSVPDGFAADVIEVPRMAAALDPATAQHLHRMLDRLAAALDA